MDVKSLVGKKIAVHCDTEEKARSFLKECKKKKIKWADGNKLTSQSYWEAYKKDTCYKIENYGVCFFKIDLCGISGCEILEYKEEKEMKFKVGDKVRTTAKCVYFEVGIIATVEVVDNMPTEMPYRISNGVNTAWVATNEIEAISSSTKSIHIYTDGNTTTAILKDGKETVKTATAKCSPEDTFDFETGAKLAFDRLMGTDKNPVKGKPKFVPHLECVKCGVKSGEIGKSIGVCDKRCCEMHIGDVVYDSLTNEVSAVSDRMCNCKDSRTVSNYHITIVKDYKDLKNGDVVNNIKYVLKED